MKLMSQLRSVSIFAAISLGALPTVAAAYCPGTDKGFSSYDPRYYSIDHEVRRSEFVVKAKVLKEIWIGEDGKPKRLQPPFQYGQSRPWGFDPYMGAFYDLRVESIFKGNPPSKFRVFSENSTARFWLRPGEEILAFASRGAFDPPIGNQLTLDTCGNFGFFPKAQRLIPAVVRASQSGRSRRVPKPH